MKIGRGNDRKYRVFVLKQEHKCFILKHAETKMGI